MEDTQKTPQQNPGDQTNKQNDQQKGNQNKDNDQDNSNKDDKGGTDKFRERESEDDHRDIPEIGEDEKEIERNTPRM